LPGRLPTARGGRCTRRSAANNIRGSIPADVNQSLSQSTRLKLVFGRQIPFFRVAISIQIPSSRRSVFSGRQSRECVAGSVREYFPPPRVHSGLFGGKVVRDCGAMRVRSHFRASSTVGSYFSGQRLGDWPRPFVFRALHLDGKRIAPEEEFHFDVILFEPPRKYFLIFVLAFEHWWKQGSGQQEGARFSRSSRSYPLGLRVMTANECRTARRPVLRSISPGSTRISEPHAREISHSDGIKSRMES